MNIFTPILPITEARSKLGDLVEQTKDDRYIILTKGGNAKAAIVDIEYLARLEKEVRTLYQKTFIDPTLLPFTREFTDEEIAAWQKEDQLT